MIDKRWKYAAAFPVFTAVIILISAWGVREKPVQHFDGRQVIEITDSLNRIASVPFDPDYIICSGPGALRLASYLKAHEKVTAVDDMEGRRPRFDARPYSLAYPGFKDLPVFGEFRGFDNPELIAALEPQPEVVFKTYPESGMQPDNLQKRTGIPVISLQYGNLTDQRNDFYASLRTMGTVLNRIERAEEVILFFEESIRELNSRTLDIPIDQKISCYVGGIAFRGPRGMQSTEPLYPPFLFVNAYNAAGITGSTQLSSAQTDVSKEKIIEWDPEIIFIDAATLQADPKSGALYQLANDPAYMSLSAVKNNNIYGVLPYNWYTQNFGSILANAWFIGKILYPDRFADIDPREKADEIYEFLTGGKVFDKLNIAFNNTAFTKIQIRREN